MRLISPIHTNVTLLFQNASRKKSKCTDFYSSDVKIRYWRSYRKLSGRGMGSEILSDEILSVLTITAVSVQTVLIQSLLNLVLLNLGMDMPTLY